jgi:hypothetical protein
MSQTFFYNVLLAFVGTGVMQPSTIPVSANTEIMAALLVGRSFTYVSYLKGEKALQEVLQGIVVERSS